MRTQRPHSGTWWKPSLLVACRNLPGWLLSFVVVIDQQHPVHLAQRPCAQPGGRRRFGAVAGGNTCSALVEAEAVEGTADRLALDGAAMPEVCPHMRAIGIHSAGFAGLRAKQHQLMAHELARENLPTQQFV